MDLVLLGGNVMTMDQRNTRAEAVAVDRGKIAAVGASAEVARQVGVDTRVVHLAGRTLIPGFMDPHNHFSLTTFEPVSVDCRTPPHQSVHSVLEAIAAAAKDAPRGRWLRAWGFRSTWVREQRNLSRGELDEVAPENPVCLIDSSVHACYANSQALQVAGIDRDTPDPAHGQIQHDAHGEPNGTLWESAMNAVYTLSLRAYIDCYKESVADLVYANAMRHLACGITCVGDALVTPEATELYRRTEQSRKLPFVLHQMFGGPHFFASPESVAMGDIHTDDVSDCLRGGTMKIFMDPVYPRYALMRHHSCDQVEHLGERYYTQEEVDHLVRHAHRRGLQVAIHCLGNWGVEQALKAFERAQREHPRPEPRFRIEHFTVTSPDQIRRAQTLGVIATMQPPFVFQNGDRMTRTAREMGGEVRALAFNSMQSAGVLVAASSDSPCAPLEPLLGLYAIVTRCTRRDGTPVSPEEAVTPLEGLRMYTANAAYAMRREHEVGSLERGKRADMVVLSHDPTVVDPTFIRDITVEQSYVDGQLLYQR